MCECVTTKTDVDIQEQNNGNCVKKKIKFLSNFKCQKVKLIFCNWVHTTDWCQIWEMMETMWLQVYESNINEINSLPNHSY